MLTLSRTVFTFDRCPLPAILRQAAVRSRAHECSKGLSTDGQDFVTFDPVSLVFADICHGDTRFFTWMRAVW